MCNKFYRFPSISVNYLKDLWSTARNNMVSYSSVFILEKKIKDHQYEYKMHLRRVKSLEGFALKYLPRFFAVYFIFTKLTSLFKLNSLYSNSTIVN